MRRSGGAGTGNRALTVAATGPKRELAPAHPAATVLLLRDGIMGPELLYLRRNIRLDFHGGAWVYPGGRIDREDFADDPSDLDSAARRAAVREAREEAGIPVDAGRLVSVAEWTTPVIRPKRFQTWFFAAVADRHEIQIDGGEIHEHRWMRPAEALAAQERGDVELPGPTYVTSHWVARYASAAEALAAFARRRPPKYLPHTLRVPGGFVSLLSEDAAFPDGDLECPGPRHRVWMVENAWRYEFSEDIEV